MSKGMITSIDTVTQVSIKFRKKKNSNKTVVISIDHNTNIKYQKGDKCVRIWKRREMRLHVQIHIRRNQNNKHTDTKGGQTYEQGHAYDKSTVLKICIEFEGKEEQNKEVVMNTKPNTNHAALAAQLERQVEKTSYTYDTDSQKQANRQGMGWGETEAIIGNAPGLGIHTRHSKQA